MNYDSSLCSQHVYSLRAPIIRNIWLFRRYVSYLALSNSTDVDSRDNSEYTRVCLYVMCDMKCVFLFLHLSFGRAALRRPLISLSPPASSVLCCSASSVCNVVLCCLLCEPLCTWYSLSCGDGISNWCHHCTAMWHLISVIFIDLQRFSVEKTEHFKFNGVNGYIPVLSIPWQKVREKWPKCQCPDEIMFWWEDNQGRKMLQNHFTLE